MPKIHHGKSALLTVGLLLVVLIITWSAGSELARPRLILQITVDQLRGDLITRYYAPEQTLRIRLSAADTDPVETFDTG